LINKKGGNMNKLKELSIDELRVNSDTLRKIVSDLSDFRFQHSGYIPNDSENKINVLMVKISKIFTEYISDILYKMK
jgi:hypothetical protein